MVAVVDSMLARLTFCNDDSYGISRTAFVGIAMHDDVKRKRMTGLRLPRLARSQKSTMMVAWTRTLSWTWYRKLWCTDAKLLSSESYYLQSSGLN